jgi:uncharacterized membrane protein
MGFSISLQRTTRHIGFKMSVANKNLGPAISPPWFDKLEIIVVLPLLIILIFYGYSKYGLLVAALVIILGFVSTVIIKSFLFPPPMNYFYRNFIYTSMLNRFANYTKSGDAKRAEAMKMYIERFEQIGFHTETYLTPTE